MVSKRAVLSLVCAVVLALGGCSRQQSEWQKTREANSTEAYEQFLKKYPSGEFTAQAQARVKELYEERDWQRARDADTPEAYQAFLKQYPEGKWTEEARIRVENFTLAQAPSGPAAAPGTVAAGAAHTPQADKEAAENPGAPAASLPPVPPKTPKPAAETSAKGAPRVAASSEPQAAAPHSKSKAGSYGVQLGAFKSGARAAHERWAHLQKQYPTLLGGLSSKVLPAKSSAGNLYRLQAVGLTEKHARAVCSSLKAKAEVCLVVSPTHG